MDQLVKNAPIVPIEIMDQLINSQQFGSSPSSDTTALLDDLESIINADDSLKTTSTNHEQLVKIPHPTRLPQTAIFPTYSGDTFLDSQHQRKIHHLFKALWEAIQARNCPQHQIM
ncbi:hypothetical protein RF11_04243 [Thelohanellus kitauei]|uniref:Uncharacterized protein n=1 Tax=Thelohanellus kitauei TaxID=669202 RepID=A0A0C2MVA3_THEKT|nr:hypothetical protein RF11_04243 [Thelohanellus kitauei]